jgi:hypothetical protein
MTTDIRGMLAVFSCAADDNDQSNRRPPDRAAGIKGATRCNILVVDFCASWQARLQCLPPRASQVRRAILPGRYA